MQHPAIEMLLISAYAKYKNLLSFISVLSSYTTLVDLVCLLAISLLTCIHVGGNTTSRCVGALWYHDTNPSRISFFPL